MINEWLKINIYVLEFLRYSNRIFKIYFEGDCELGFKFFLYDIKFVFLFEDLFCDGEIFIESVGDLCC